MRRKEVAVYHGSLGRYRRVLFIDSRVNEEKKRHRRVYKIASFHVCFSPEAVKSYLFCVSFVCLQHCTDFIWFFAFIVCFFYNSAITEQKGPAAAWLNTSIVHRKERERAHQTWPPPGAFCADPGRMDRDVKNVHLYINTLSLAFSSFFFFSLALFVSVSRRCSWICFYFILSVEGREYSDQPERRDSILHVYDCSF